MNVGSRRRRRWRRKRFERISHDCKPNYGM